MINFKNKCGILFNTSMIATFLLLTSLAYAQTQQKIDISLQIHSGIPNPTWTINNPDEIDQLQELIKDLPNIPSVRTPHFGVFILLSNDTISGFPQTIYVYNGVIEATKSDGITGFFQDIKGLKEFLINKAIGQNIKVPLAMRGDLDGDQDIDQDDVNILLEDRNKSISQSACGVRCDFNGDGKIDDIDAQFLVTLCTENNACEVTPVPDTTPPILSLPANITAEATGPAGATVTYTVSALDQVDGAVTPICTPASSSTFALGTTNVSCSATDKAGNTASGGFSITVRDTIPPTITGSASPAANANGWRNSAVTVSFTCADGASGIAACTAPQSLGQGANQSVNGTATDKAGNSASAAVTGINADLTAPVVSVTGVANGAIYTNGAVPAAGCATTDALSGVQTNATLNVTGGNVSGVGTFTAACTGAMDKAGNTGTASATYQVNGVPPGSDSAFSAFTVNQLRINQRLNTIFLLSNFTLGQGGNGIDPVKDAVTFTLANFTTTIPAGSFRKGPAGVYSFVGKINKIGIEMLITPLGNNRFLFQAAAYDKSLDGITNPVTMELTIGNDHGTASVNAVLN